MPQIEPCYTDASHHMGTTRMSEDPRSGVVDRNSRVHGVDNLYVAGSSVFPSAGHANPTLTIVALALRLAEHLRRIERGEKTSLDSPGDDISSSGRDCAGTSRPAGRHAAERDLAASAE
jgi:choline dehydrogenase-like flavoprotein